MDISFSTPSGRFNYRVCGVILKNNHLLTMRDELSLYAYLPGGRVKLHEAADAAILRELKEELHIDARIDRLLWFCESFFIEKGCGERFHEICLYYLIDISHTALQNSCASFTIPDNGHSHVFTWTPIERLKEMHVYPLFIREKIHTLPRAPEFIIEAEA